MAALVAAMTSGSLPLLMAGTMAGHDEIIRRLTLHESGNSSRISDPTIDRLINLACYSA
jgi:hypothetical protein